MITGDNTPDVFVYWKEAGFEVETEVSLRIIFAMTFDAVLVQDGEHLFVEVHLSLLLSQEASAQSESCGQAQCWQR